MRRLEPCPRRPNCVGTLEAEGPKRMEPIPFRGSSEEALGHLRRLLSAMPRTRIVSATGDYLHAEARSRRLRFVDDVEFVVDPEEKLIHFRSAARVGIRDFGVNRRRMEEVCRAFALRQGQEPENTP